MIVRSAILSDAPAIATLLHHAFIEYELLYTAQGFAATTPSESVIRARMSEGPVWIALRDCFDIVGTVSVVPKENALYIRSMAVSQHARNIGIAGSLLRHVETYARSHRFERLILSTTPFLLAAIRLYEKFGFHRTLAGPHQLFGTPLFTMEKNLVLEEQ
jgi:GNAT superfamily N-acetyltransferase